ncbi:MAG: DUF2065 domain-containing protein [Marinagarivorans sp.]|nr:DUF2065 domain-containing protein [Marinagarivorans sp.]
MLETFLQALCLVLVIEGLLPFMYPGRWRSLVAQLATVNNTQLRVMGLVSMLLGAGFLFLLK